MEFQSGLSSGEDMLFHSRENLERFIPCKYTTTDMSCYGIVFVEKNVIAEITTQSMSQLLKRDIDNFLVT